MPHRCIYCGGAAAAATLLRPAVDSDAELRMHAAFFRAYTGCRFITEANHLCSTHRGFAHTRTIPRRRPFDEEAFTAALRALQLDEQRPQVWAYGASRGLLPGSTASASRSEQPASTGQLVTASSAAAVSTASAHEIQHTIPNSANSRSHPLDSCASAVPLLGGVAAASCSSLLSPAAALQPPPSMDCADDGIRHLVAAAAAASFAVAVPQLRAVSLREVSPGDDNHCFFHAVGEALGGKTHQQLRALLDRGLDKLDSVHLLTRYDLCRESPTAGGPSGRFHQQVGESAEAYALRQRRLLRQFRASYRKRSVYRDLSMGGTPEMLLLSHALDGALVFLVYNSVAPPDVPTDLTPHLWTSIHALTAAEQADVRSGRNVYAGAGAIGTHTFRQRLPPATVQICLLHCAYRGQGETANHWDMFHFYVQGFDGESPSTAATQPPQIAAPMLSQAATAVAAALPCWPDYERECEAHEQLRRSEMARIAVHIQQLQRQSRQLAQFVTQHDLSAQAGAGPKKRAASGGAVPVAATAAAAAASRQRQPPQPQRFPCGPTVPVDHRCEAIEAQLELRLSATTGGKRVGVFVVGALRAGTRLPYPCVLMTKYMQQCLLRACDDFHTGLQLHFDEIEDRGQAGLTGRKRDAVDERLRRALHGHIAVGWPLRKGPLLNSLNRTGSTSVLENCRLLQLSTDELVAWRGYRQGRGALPDTLISVELLRDVTDEELLCTHDLDYWRRSSPTSPEPVSSAAAVSSSLPSSDNGGELLPASAAASAVAASATAASATAASTAGADAPAASAAAACAAPPCHTVIPCLPPLQHVPMEVLSMGVVAWRRQRVASGMSPAHAQAVDEAMAELGWELADQLTDGARLELPEFKRARRSESREAAASYSGRMEGERRCNMIVGILQKLMETSAR